MRYHYLYILLLATLCVVLKQAYAGAADMQGQMKQRQELQKVKDPSFEKLMKMKRKNGFLSRKKKKVATEKNSAAGNIETKVVKTEQNLIRSNKKDIEQHTIHSNSKKKSYSNINAVTYEYLALVFYLITNKINSLVFLD